MTTLTDLNHPDWKAFFGQRRTLDLKAAKLYVNDMLTTFMNESDATKYGTEMPLEWIMSMYKDEIINGPQGKQIQTIKLLSNSCETNSLQNFLEISTYTETVVMDAYNKAVLSIDGGDHARKSQVWQLDCYWNSWFGFNENWVLEKSFSNRGMLTISRKFRAASLGLYCKDLIGKRGFTKKDYDVLTQDFMTVFGSQDHDWVQHIGKR